MSAGAAARRQTASIVPAAARADELPLEVAPVVLGGAPGACALEDDDFPFEALSEIAEAESWRKKVYRPTTHIHKWWAQRLGTVFRAMALGAFAPKGADLMKLFYQPVRIGDAVVFDPFMGSGTTVAEAVKLGARSVGRDINPVAHFLVRCALSVHDRKAILDAFQAIKRDVAVALRTHYRMKSPDGRNVADVLYYFWVMVVDCPSCEKPVDLFSSMVFARRADPAKDPWAVALCPHCDRLQKVRHDDHDAQCSSCEERFDPGGGPARGRSAVCPACANLFPIAKTVRAQGQPPKHRLYAKLVLTPGGAKCYLSATKDDQRSFARAERALAQRKNPFPLAAIAPGRNTDQALGYNYRRWHQMFNARQLLCLSILADRIRAIQDPALKELFTCLFSGALEFNNMFASYKGEGTGAVRHMFSHHILKPERPPIEANLWGTPKSSGSFLTMFEGRIRRALDYADDPFELRVTRRKGRKKNEKVFGLSEKIGLPIAGSHAEFADGRRVYLSCGDSAGTDLPDRSVDAVLTDPPFFDNMHYSELADFFHVWQRHILGNDGRPASETTRSEREVQHTRADDFTERLTGVWKEARRVLKDDGLLAFTYHHSRPEGWRCVLQALMDAGFGITAVQPIKAEMSVAVPKRQTREPINLDIIVVCRKREGVEEPTRSGDPLDTVAAAATGQACRLIDAGRRLSRNDVRVIFMAQEMRALSRMSSVENALERLDGASGEIEAFIVRLHAIQNGQ